MAAGQSEVIRNHAAFIWSVADLLRGDYKQSEYGRVILPLTVLRRLDCVLAPTKDAVLARAAQLAGRVENIAPVLERVAGQQFFNTSRLDFTRLLDAPEDLAGNLRHYVHSFSSAARDVLDKFDFDTQITRLDRSNLLYLVVSRFAGLDLHPDRVSNLEMGYLYEELVRRFSELSKRDGRRALHASKVASFRVPLPPLDEQRCALSSYRTESAQFTQASALLARQIELLREHRQALITAAVTGELDVAGVAA